MDEMPMTPLHAHLPPPMGFHEPDRISHLGHNLIMRTAAYRRRIRRLHPNLRRVEQVDRLLYL
jgi:hypothetical protein